jgi:hypothetical protein
MLQKGCECREEEVKERKQKWDEVFMNEMRKGKRGERERGKKEREKVKCHKMFEQERTKGLIHSFS